MKKLSTYFFTAVFFIGGLPQKCKYWPYPGDDEKNFVEVQQIINTPKNELEITIEIT